MSRATVRSAVVSWLNPINLVNVGSVLASFPKVADPRLFAVTGQASGALVVVFVSGESEERPAVGGKKRVWYKVELHVFLRSVEPDALAAMNAFDTCIDSIKVRLRSDHTLGGLLWQAAEPALDAEYGEPMLNGEVTEIWGRLSFVAHEWLDIA